MYIYKNMAEIRKKRGLTQGEIAEVLGVTRQQYQLYESGTREIKLHLMIVLADYYGVTLDYLADRNEKVQEAAR